MCRLPHSVFLGQGPVIVSTAVGHRDPPSKWRGLEVMIKGKDCQVLVNLVSGWFRKSGSRNGSDRASTSTSNTNQTKLSLINPGTGIREKNANSDLSGRTPGRCRKRPVATQGEETAAAEPAVLFLLCVKALQPQSRAMIQLIGLEFVFSHIEFLRNHLLNLLFLWAINFQENGTQKKKSLLTFPKQNLTQSKPY